MESKTTNATSSASKALIVVGPLLIGIIVGFYYDLFISGERGWSFLLYVVPVLLSYLPTFIAISDLQKRRDLESGPKLLWAIALLMTWIFGAAVYFGTSHGRTEKARPE